MAARTENHRKLAEKMRTARAQASHPVMSRVEFLAQTPQELRIARAAGLRVQKSNDKP